jgi:hypothetical protein
MMTNINIKNIETRQPTNLVIHKEKMKKERDKEVKNLLLCLICYRSFWSTLQSNFFIYTLSISEY